MEKLERSVRIDPQRLKITMTAAGIHTDKELAEKANITIRTITNVKKFGTCSWDAWNSIASAIGCNPIDLLVTQGYPDPKWAALAALSV